MTFALICLGMSLFFVTKLKHGDEKNPNGLSVSLLQQNLLRLQLFFLSHPKVSVLVFAYPRIKFEASLLEKQAKIESLVWNRLIIVAVLAILADFCISNLWPWLSFGLRIAVVLYLMVMQCTLFLALLRPLFGVVVDRETGGIDQLVAHQTVPHIPSPRRSLFMALVNFAEIVITWALIYRSIAPDQILTMDQANYFSVVTFTTLGYGEINAGAALALQLAVSLNMLVFLVFTICHVTTIMGAMSSSEVDE